RLKGQTDDGIAAYREAVRIDPQFAQAHYHLGTALALNGQIDEAIPAFRAALRADKGHVDSRHNLAAALAMKNRWDQAKVEFRALIPLVKDDPKALAQAQTDLRRTQRLAALDARLPAVLRGEDQPKNAAECLDFTLLCRPPHREYYARAARFFDMAFALEP